MNGCYYFLKNSNLFDYFTRDYSVAAFLIASLTHDIDHPGNNNDFEIKTESEKALIYNGKSVLENHHCFQTFKLLRKESCNIFSEMNKEDFGVFRKIVIELILMTDPKNHFEQLKEFKSRVNNN